MALEVRRDPDRAAFRDAAGHGLMLSILDGIERGRRSEVERTLVRRDGWTVAVGLPAPPHDPVLSVVDDPELEAAALGPTPGGIRIGCRPVRDDTHWTFVGDDG